MKASRGFVYVVLALLTAFGAGCASSSNERVGSAPGAVAERKAAWVRTELFFSIGDWMETALSTEAQARWETFVEKEVTPRFPDGLTVFDGYGQWRDAADGANAPVQRERTRVLVVLHADTPEAARKVEEIRTAWKAATGDKSVLKVSSRAEVSF